MARKHARRVRVDHRDALLSRVWQACINNPHGSTSMLSSFAPFDSPAIWYFDSVFYFI